MSQIDDTERLRLHGHPISTFTRTATMACIEKGVPYELILIRYGSPEHAALHPFSRIPVLEHGDTVLFETLAITSYIDERFDGPALQPAGPRARARMLEWLSLCSDYVYRNVVRGIPRDRAPTEDERTAARLVLERVDAMVRTPFLIGDALSLADLYLAPQVANAREKAPDRLASLAATQEWLEGIAERESFRRTVYDANPKPN